MIMDKDNFRQQRLIHEYNTLRAEVLQVYDQQSSLVFGAAIAAAGSIIVTLARSPVNLLGLPALLAILIGVCYKSITNYCRIYRIGSYIAIFHEQKEILSDSYNPGPDTAAYHTRWRRASGKGLVPLTGGSGTNAEAWFLLVLRTASWMLWLGTVATQPVEIVFMVGTFVASVSLSTIFFVYLKKLKGVYQFSKIYLKGFREALDQELRLMNQYSEANSTNSPSSDLQTNTKRSD
jgi:hypothetical protein